MYVDSALEMSNGQAVTAAAASTNVIDLGSTKVNLGVGKELYLVVLVTVAFTDAGSDSTLAVILQKDTVEGFGSPETAQTIGTFGALSAIGSRLVARLQPDAIDQQFLRMFYTPAGGDLTTGSLDAFITSQIAADDEFASGFIVS